MDAPKCKTCGTTHWGVCLSQYPSSTGNRPATKSTADGKDRSQAPQGLAPRIGGQQEGASDRDAVKVVAGTQAPPVDISRAAADAAAKSKRGRKPTGFDKKAYDREKARERRAAKKGQPK